MLSIHGLSHIETQAAVSQVLLRGPNEVALGTDHTLLLPCFICDKRHSRITASQQSSLLEFSGAFNLVLLLLFLVCFGLFCFDRVSRCPGLPVSWQTSPVSQGFGSQVRIPMSVLVKPPSFEPQLGLPLKDHPRRSESRSQYKVCDHSLCYLTSSLQHRLCATNTSGVRNK